MSRHLLILDCADARAKAAKLARTAPPGTRVEFKATRRTLPQNDRMWAMLTDIASQCEIAAAIHAGPMESAFMHACGQEVQFIPAPMDQGSSRGANRRRSIDRRK